MILLNDYIIEPRASGENLSSRFIKKKTVLNSIRKGKSFGKECEKVCLLGLRCTNEWKLTWTLGWVFNTPNSGGGAGSLNEFRFLFSFLGALAHLHLHLLQHRGAALIRGFDIEVVEMVIALSSSNAKWGNEDTESQPMERIRRHNNTHSERTVVIKRERQGKGRREELWNGPFLIAIANSNPINHPKRSKSKAMLKGGGCLPENQQYQKSTKRCCCQQICFAPQYLTPPEHWCRRAKVAVCMYCSYKPVLITWIFNDFIKFYFTLQKSAQ